MYLLNWASVVKKNFLTILKQKITLNHFGKLIGYISPINKQGGMHILPSLKKIKFYLKIIKLQMFSIIIFNQSLKTLAYLNGQVN